MPLKTDIKAPDYGPFKDATRKAFSFLLEPPYDFKEIEAHDYGRECAISFENSTTGVMVTRELESTPWVVVSRLNSTSFFRFEDEAYGLHQLAAERCPSEVDRIGPEQIDNIEDFLNDLAQILKQCGHDVLTGDFRVFSKLKKFAKAEGRRRERELKEFLKRKR